MQLYTKYRNLLAEIINFDREVERALENIVGSDPSHNSFEFVYDRLDQLVSKNRFNILMHLNRDSRRDA
jgi:hypothetical protein